LPLELWAELWLAPPAPSPPAPLEFCDEPAPLPLDDAALDELAPVSSPPPAPDSLVATSLPEQLASTPNKSAAHPCAVNKRRMLPV
jgi:hypothetical protein